LTHFCQVLLSLQIWSLKRPFLGSFKVWSFSYCSDNNIRWALHSKVNLIHKDTIVMKINSYSDPFFCQSVQCATLPLHHEFTVALWTTRGDAYVISFMSNQKVILFSWHRFKFCSTSTVFKKEYSKFSVDRAMQIRT
jgi:hypothetical protein